MSKIILTIILFLFVDLLHAQNPLVKQWDYRFGGTYAEQAICFQQTTDGGYILGGNSASQISGDKTQGNWDSTGLTYDFYIVKLDSMGNKEWDKGYGGLSNDVLVSLQQTTDGGYILGGWSSSHISGDKTQDTWGGYTDYWIVKVDSVGNKQWDKDIGGAGFDDLYSLQQTSDGGYILGGTSESQIGGAKTQSMWGWYDYWIVKIDALGIIEWDKDFGGTHRDVLYSIEQTSDGGFILGGASASQIGGDKSQGNRDTIGTTFDYWIVKIDSLGIKQWDKVFGGTDNDYLNSVHQTTDGGFILGGWSYSGMNGDRTELNRDTAAGTADYWIVKIDSLGNRQWDKAYGGSSTDQFFSMTQVSDNGYLISGDSYSPISGEKSESNLGARQTWIVKTDSFGNKQWDKTLFVNNDVEAGYAIQTKDGCYTFLNDNDGTIAGDKTQDSWNYSYDIWVIKFCDTTLMTGGMNAIEPVSEISVYPNPFTAIVSINVPKQFAKHISFTIENLLGETVFSKMEDNLNESTKMFDLSFLLKGIYILRIAVDRDLVVRKIVKD